MRGVPGIDLAHQEHFIAPPVDGLGDQFLGLTVAVHLCRIDQREAEVETLPQGGYFLAALVAILAPVPGALAKGRHALAGRQGYGLHLSLRVVMDALVFNRTTQRLTRRHGAERD